MDDGGVRGCTGKLIFGFWCLISGHFTVSVIRVDGAMTDKPVNHDDFPYAFPPGYGRKAQELLYMVWDRLRRRKPRSVPALYET